MRADRIAFLWQTLAAVGERVDVSMPEVFRLLRPQMLERGIALRARVFQSLCLSFGE